MTTPPYGPYGQDPSGKNPYGQDPYWGGQPQGGPLMGGPPPGGPYPPPQGYPYPPAPYGPPPGQPFPPGGPMGPFPPGPPGPRSKTPWLIGAGIAVVLIGALVAALVHFHGHPQGRGNEPTTAMPPAPSSTTPGGPSTAHNATDCTPNASAGTLPSGDTVSAGPLSFPTSAAPGWTPFADESAPNGIDVVGVAREVPGAEKWVMQAEVGITNFVASMDVGAQASKLMTCIADGPGYDLASPSLGPTKTSSITVDGTEAARVDADITLADTSRGVKGDSVVIIVVNTKPATFFYGATPIGDADSRGIIEQVIAALKVTKS